MDAQLTLAMIDVAHEAALLRNEDAGRHISQWIRDNDEKVGLTGPMWEEMKAHRRHLRSIGEYPVRRPKPASRPFTSLEVSLLLGSYGQSST